MISIWTGLWLIWIFGFFAIEIPALLNKEEGDTLTDHVRKWFSTTEKSKWWIVRRIFLLTFLIWLIVHFFTLGLV